MLEFAQRTGLPVFNSTKYGGLMPMGHPLRAGQASALAMLSGKEGDEKPDLIILLGVRTGLLLGGRGGLILPREGCKFIQIDLDGSEIGRSHAIDLGIVADAVATLKAFNLALTDSTDPIDVPLEWVKKASGLQKTKSPHEDEDHQMPDGRPHPYHAVKQVYRSLREGSIVIIDGGEASCWAQDLVEQHARASAYIVSTGYLGFIGNGWGYALGAALADPTRQIVHITGDGSAGFHIAELETYARHNLNILTVILNNSVWGMSQSGQELIYGEATKARPVSKLSTVTRYEMVAEGFGCTGARAEKVSEIEGTVAKLSRTRGPGCLNMIISDKPMHAVTKAMVGNTDDENVIVVPYYDNLPRPRYHREEDLKDTAMSKEHTNGSNGTDQPESKDKPSGVV